MAKNDKIVPRSDNPNVVLPNIDDYFVCVAEPGAFTAGANLRGNHNGTNDPTTLFTVTGDVIVRVFGVCTVDLAGATATLEVGTAKATAGLIAQTTGTDIDANELWHDATPDTNIEATTVAPARFIVNGGDIIETIGTADLTGGNIYYVCLWRPLTPGSSVVAAV